MGPKKILLELLLIVCASPSSAACFRRNQKQAAAEEHLQTTQRNFKSNFFWDTLYRLCLILRKSHPFWDDFGIPSSPIMIINAKKAISGGSKILTYFFTRDVPKVSDCEQEGQEVFLFGVDLKDLMIQNVNLFFTFLGLTLASTQTSLGTLMQFGCRINLQAY